MSRATMAASAPKIEMSPSNRPSSSSISSPKAVTASCNIARKPAKDDAELNQSSSKVIKLSSLIGQKACSLTTGKVPSETPSTTKTNSSKDASDEDSDDGVAISQSATCVQQFLAANGTQPSISTPGAAPDACKPPKAQTPLRRRQPLAQVMDPLIPGDSRVFSKRIGSHWMDGYFILTYLARTYMRPWDDCIPSEELSVDNLPPFFVRLRDDQVGHLFKWMVDADRIPISTARACLYWPHDIGARLSTVNHRQNWGKPYDGKSSQGKLGGGTDMPAYIDVGLPPTYVSSGKAMCRVIATESPGDTTNKRKACEMLDERTDRSGKRFCTWASPETREEVMQAFVDKIDAVKAECRSKLEILEADVASKKKTTDVLKHAHQEALVTIQARDEMISARDSQLDKLSASTTGKERIIADLESASKEQCKEVKRLEAKIKNQGTDLQSWKTKYTAECRDRVTADAKKAKELKDANTKIKSLLKSVADRDQTIKSNCQAFAKHDERISFLEGKLRKAGGKEAAGAGAKGDASEREGAAGKKT